MTRNDYTNYFLSLAQGALFGHTPEVARFATVSADEIENGLRTNLDMASGFCLLLEQYDSELSHGDAGQGTQIKFGGLLILKEVGRAGHQASNSIQDAAEELAKKLWAKLLHDLDAYHSNPSTAFALKYLDRRKFTITTVEGLFDGAAGVRCEFSTRERYAPSVIYQSSDWTITP